MTRINHLLKNTSHPVVRRLFIALALLLIILPVLQPFTTGRILRTDDGNLHLYRAVVLQHSLQHDGAIWPRYSSGFVYGYGSALFNYFPPTSYYLPVLLHALGLSFVLAWNWSMIFYVVLAAVNMFLLAQYWTNAIGGVMGAAAYIYAPYLLFDTITRGTSSEVAALALLPLTLWAFARLAHSAKRLDFVLAVMSYAAFILMHNIITLHGTVLLIIYCLYLWLGGTHQWRTLAQLLLAGIFGSGMTAFFWLPALIETDFTRINSVMANLASVDVTQTLRPLVEVLALPRTADPTQLQAPMPIALGWPQILLSFVGLSLATWQQSKQASAMPRRLFRLQLVMAGFITLVVLMQLEISAPLWRVVPLIGFSQFAWRLLGLASLALALLVAIGTWFLLEQIRAEWLQIAVICALLAISVLYGVPWLYTSYIDLQANSVVDAHNYERQTGELSLSSYSEYLPVWNTSALSGTKLQDDFAQAGVVPRLQTTDEITVLNADWGGTQARIAIRAERATVLVFDWLYVPGWIARFEDTLTSNITLSVQPTQSEGLVSVDIPAGEHTLFIALQNTQLQLWSNLISIVATLSIIPVLVGAWRFWIPSNAGLAAATQFSNRWLVAISGAALALLLIKNAYIDRTQTIFKRERFIDGQIANLENPLYADFSGQIRLLGSDIQKSVVSGDLAEFRLFWTVATDNLETDYSSILHLRDSAGNIVAEGGSFQPGQLATSHWEQGFYLEEIVNFEIPDFMPPGLYMLDVGLFNPETQQRLAVLNEAGNPVDSRIVVATLEVMRPDAISQSVSHKLESLKNFDLLEINGLPSQVQVGEALGINWLWQMREADAEDFQVQLAWADEQGEIRARSPFIDLVAHFPTSQWQPEDKWRGHHTLFVPGSLEAATYDVLIIHSSESIAVATMDVSTPNRNFDIPEFEYASDLMWQNGIHLLGYDKSVTGVTLLWQTSEALNRSLRLFTQVVDENNQIIALTDGIPVNWTRPTSSWARGEVIATHHDFGDLPSGTYRVRIGWYDSATGTRIPLEDNTDAAFLPTPLGDK